MNPFSLSGIDRIALMETFVRIVDAGSLSASAAQLGTSQATLSRRLQALERALGLKLLQRTTHVMTLTDDGQRCYLHAKALLDNWHGIEQDLRGAAEEPRGVLRVLAPHAFGQKQLITPLPPYLRRFPAMTVQWMLHDRRPDFIAEGVDCAIQEDIRLNRLQHLAPEWHALPLLVYPQASFYPARPVALFGCYASGYGAVARHAPAGSRSRRRHLTLPQS